MSDAHPGPFRCASFKAVTGGRDKVEADFAVLAGLSRGLSGEDILNVCLNAIHAGSAHPDPAKWRVTQGMLEREIEKARAAREEHEGKAKRGKQVIGFGQV